MARREGRGRATRSERYPSRGCEPQGRQPSWPSSSAPGRVTGGSEETFNLSQSVEEIDIFLSHSWRDSGLLKYLALCLHFNGLVAMVAALISGFIRHHFLPAAIRPDDSAPVHAVYECVELFHRCMPPVSTRRTT